MKQLFHIKEEAGTGATDVLLMETGEDYCCVAICDGSTKQIQDLQYFSFKRFAFDSIQAIWTSVKDSHPGIQKVVCCSALPQSILLPEIFFNDESKQIVQSVYTLPNPVLLHDEVNKWKLYTVYAIPRSLHDINTAHYNDVEYIHAYTVAIQSNNQVRADSHILVQFAVSTFRVKVKKGNNLLLVQTFTFQTPLDVVYVLIKICTELEISQEQVYITLSGLIDADSDLYKELYQYFLQLHFAPLPDKVVIPGPYPPHFFASLYNLALCVL